MEPGAFYMILVIVALMTAAFCIDAFFPMLEDKPKKEIEKRRADRKFILEDEEN